jgi:hypothetical protein
MSVFLMEHQAEFMQGPYLYPEIQNFFLVAGYQSGKTSALAMSVEYAIHYYQGKKNRRGEYARLGVVGFELEHLERTFLPYLLSDLDASKTKYKKNAKDNSILIGTVTLYFISLSMEKKTFGYSMSAIFVDEIDECPLEAVMANNKTLHERLSQQMLGCRSPWIQFGSTAQGINGLYQLYLDMTKNNTPFILIRGSTRNNKSLPESYVKGLKAVYTPEEQKAFLDGYFIDVSSAKIIPHFHYDKHFVNGNLEPPLGSDERVYISQDLNESFSRGCAAVYREGTIHIIKRYDFVDLSSAPSIMRFDFPTNKLIWIPDASAVHEINHYKRDLIRHKIGIAAMSKNPFKEDICFVVSKLFYMDKIFIYKEAQTLAEMLQIAFRDDTGKIPKGQTQSCLVAETKVMTLRGKIRIDSVVAGDEVLTRKGWRKVAWCKMTKIDNVVKFDGKLTGTADHPIGCGNKFVAMGMLTPFDTYDTIKNKEYHKCRKLRNSELQLVQMVKNVKLLSGTGFGSTDVLNQKTGLSGNIFLNCLQQMLKGFISKFGNFITEKCLMAILYIIKTQICKTTTYPILSALLHRITQNYIGQKNCGKTPMCLTKEKNGLRRQEGNALNGNEAKKVWSFIENMENNRGKKSKKLNTLALSVEKLLLQEASNITSCIAVQTVAQKPLVGADRRIKKLKNKRPVWDIGVVGEHEFVAQGIIVHNSPVHDIDAISYLTHYLVSTKTELRSMMNLMHKTIRDEPQVSKKGDFIVVER